MSAHYRVRATVQIEVDIYLHGEESASPEQVERAAAALFRERMYEYSMDDAKATTWVVAEYRLDGCQPSTPPGTLSLWREAAHGWRP